MATQRDVRRIALSLPGATEVDGRFAFEVLNKGKPKGFVWAWNERVDPKKPRVPNPGVIAVRVPNLTQKDLLLAADRVKFFTEPHYNGYPAVLVRLDKVSVAELEILVADAWRCQAPRELVGGGTVNATTGATRGPAKTAAKRSRSAPAGKVQKRTGKTGKRRS